MYTTSDAGLAALLKSATAQPGNIALYAFANKVPDAIPADIQAEAASFSGNYLTYSFSYFPGYISVAWMSVFSDAKTCVLGFELGGGGADLVGRGASR
jgi:hypothetical protein